MQGVLSCEAGDGNAAFPQPVRALLRGGREGPEGRPSRPCWMLARVRLEITSVWAERRTRLRKVGLGQISWRFEGEHMAAVRGPGAHGCRVGKSGGLRGRCGRGGRVTRGPAMCPQEPPGGRAPPGPPPTTSHTDEEPQGQLGSGGRCWRWERPGLVGGTPGAQRTLQSRAQLAPGPLVAAGLSLLRDTGVKPEWAISHPLERLLHEKCTENPLRCWWERKMVQPL